MFKIDSGTSEHTFTGKILHLTPKSISGGAEELVNFEQEWCCSVTLPETDSGKCYEVGERVELESHSAWLSNIYISPINLVCEMGELTENMNTTALVEAGGGSVIFTDADGSQYHLTASMISAQRADMMDFSDDEWILYALFPMEKVIDSEQVVSVTFLGQTFCLNDFVLSDMEY